MAESKASRPYCTILAGPNGSGKSSIYPVLDPVGEFVNADVVARKLAPQNPEGASMAAGRLVLAAIEEMLGERRSFVYETTLSSRQSLKVMERCKALGYEIAFVFVALDSADLNVERVAQRVIAGGHHIDEIVVRRRYETTFGRLPTALQLSDTALVFDNSGLKPLLLLTIDGRRIIQNRLDEASSLHLRLAGAVAEAFYLDVETVLLAGMNT
ncbi:hypothetical protein ASG43_04645 [Aureimonas sp. Leaf454]|uniref:zeta toxin family protein n=1 Tax=Aureimonas sp. Leaf454 TaxID=1736381 RepID=UPI000715CBED|nr:zeta toxin family protein [Aureimonas sp. Leaf454]KQT54839.1 hypothetical protein ASG43_04645 [Aureimonas sp. Leaf454]